MTKLEPLPPKTEAEIRDALAREDLEWARFYGYEFFVNTYSELRWKKARGNTKEERRQFMAVMEIMDKPRVVQILKKYEPARIRQQRRSERTEAA